MIRSILWVSAFLSCMLLGLDSPEALAADGPGVRIDTTFGDFGEVRQGKVVSQAFTIGNTGNRELRIEKIEFSAPGMNVAVKQVIAPGMTTVLDLTMDTSHQPRDAEASAIIYLNDPLRPKVKLTITGTVIPPIEFLPMPSFYLSQFEGEARSRSVTLLNNQESNIRITELEPQGEHFTASFRELESGRQYLVNVTTSANAPIGRHFESLVVHTNDPNYPSIHLQVNLLVKPDIFLAPEEVDFGRISINRLKQDAALQELVQQTVVINRRRGKMSILSAESDIPAISVKAEPKGPSQTFMLMVGLKSEKLKRGEIQGNIRLKTDDPGFPELLIPVTGVIEE
jgi:hypothetical protein